MAAPHRHLERGSAGTIQEGPDRVDPQALDGAVVDGHDVIPQLQLLRSCGAGCDLCDSVGSGRTFSARISRKEAVSVMVMAEIRGTWARRLKEEGCFEVESGEKDQACYPSAIDFDFVRMKIWMSRAKAAKT